LVNDGVAAFTVKLPVPVLPADVESPAKLAPSPVAYVPALIPVRLAVTVASPDALVVAEPAAEPFNVKLIVLPATAGLNVADKFALPP